MRIINGDCLKVLPTLTAAMVFADPPDNLGLAYGTHCDRMPPAEYSGWLYARLTACVKAAPIVWVSFNVRWLAEMERYLIYWPRLEVKRCVQTFTFGQHRQTDLGNNWRPLWRLRRDNAPLYPDQVRIPSQRQAMGDKLADPRGRVPGDVFEFARVTGNSRQRRKWHPTQLNEGLVERCVLLCTKPGDTVVDPFAGTGTTLRVCKRLGRNAIGIEIDASYCQTMGNELQTL